MQEKRSYLTQLNEDFVKENGSTSNGNTPVNGNSINGNSVSNGNHVKEESNNHKNVVNNDTVINIEMK